jgi:hypothetical protein
MTVRKIRRYPGLAPDEILFHEIVHASRLIGNDFGPRNEEEFFAVLVTNIYMSEKGKRFSELRYRYDARSRGLKASEAQPYGFLLQTDEVMNEDHYVLIDKYCRQHPQVAPMIAKAPVEFNPIREYYALKEKNPISRMF